MEQSNDSVQNQAKSEETVVVKKVVLDKILADLERLNATADKSRLAWYDNQNKKGRRNTVRINTFMVDGVDKIVVAWRMVSDTVFKDGNGIWHENQIIEMIFEDNTTIQVSYRDFAIMTKKDIVASIVKREVDQDTLIETLKVEMPDGKVLEIDSRFVN